jgi:hypothetical protein
LRGFRGRFDDLGGNHIDVSRRVFAFLAHAGSMPDRLSIGKPFMRHAYFKLTHYPENPFLDATRCAC